MPLLIPETEPAHVTSIRECWDRCAFILNKLDHGPLRQTRARLLANLIDAASEMRGVAWGYSLAKEHEPMNGPEPHPIFDYHALNRIAESIIDDAKAQLVEIAGGF